MARELTLRQRQFVAAYLGGASATQAAVAAGYSAHSAKSRAHVLTSNKLVKAELDRVRSALAKKAEYSAEQCAAAIDALIAKADARGNDSAMASYHQQKMKLYGLLIDKQHITVEPVDLAGALADAKARALRLRCDPASTIDGEFVALPDFATRRPTDKQSIAPLNANAPDHL